MGSIKGHLITLAIALGAVWIANNVEFVGKIVGPKAK